MGSVETTLRTVNGRKCSGVKTEKGIGRARRGSTSLAPSRTVVRFYFVDSSILSRLEK